MFTSLLLFTIGRAGIFQVEGEDGQRDVHWRLFTITEQWREAENFYEQHDKCLVMLTENSRNLPQLNLANLQGPTSRDIFRSSITRFLVMESGRRTGAALCPVNIDNFRGFLLFVPLCSSKSQISLNWNNDLTACFILQSLTPQEPVAFEGKSDWTKGKMEVGTDTITFKSVLQKLVFSEPLGWAYDINFTLGTKIKWCCQCHCSVYKNICDDLSIALLQLAWEQALFLCADFHKAGVCPTSKRMCGKKYGLWW